jgi:vitamin B12 transporter
MTHHQARALARAPTTFAILAGFGALPNGAGAQGAAHPGLEEIIVTSSIIEQPRRQIGTAVSVVTFEDIELRGYNDLVDVLRTQIGIGVSSSGGPGKLKALRIRGEESFRTLLMIDGVKALDASAPQVAPSFDSLLSTTDLQRVEILRGPQGFIYGADAGGVVSVLTKTGAGRIGGRIGLEGGEFGTRKLDASVAGGSDEGDYFVSVTDLQTDGFNAQTADTVLRDADGASNTTAHAKLGWNVSDDLRLQLVARDIDASSLDDGCFTASGLVHDCSSTTQQMTYKVSLDYDRGDFSHAFGYSNVSIARDNVAEGLSAFSTEGELGRIEYTGSYRPDARLAVVYGLDVQDEGLVGDNETLNRDQKGYYLEYQGAFADSLFVAVGARYDDNDAFGSHTSTRISAAYLQDLGVDRTLKYRASYGTGFRAPSVYEISYNAGPFAVPPAAGFVLTEEISRGYDLGVEYTAANGAHFEASYFDQDIDDEIYFDLAAFSGYLQSPGTSESKGVEIAARVPFGESFELLANWTANDAKNSSNQQRVRRPKNIGNLGLRYRAPNEKLNFVANYRLAKDAIDNFGALEDYAVLDFSMGYSLTTRFELHARIENAADEEYEEVLGYYTARRATYAGVRMRF